MKPQHTPTDTAMENLAVLDLLEREGYSQEVIDRIEKAVNNHEVLLEAIRIALVHGDFLPRVLNILEKAIKQAEGK